MISARCLACYCLAQFEFHQHIPGAIPFPYPIQSTSPNSIQIHCLSIRLNPVAGRWWHCCSPLQSVSNYPTLPLYVRSVLSPTLQEGSTCVLCQLESTYISSTPPVPPSKLPRSVVPVPARLSLDPPLPAGLPIVLLLSNTRDKKTPILPIHTPTSGPRT